MRFVVLTLLAFCSLSVRAACEWHVYPLANGGTRYVLDCDPDDPSGGGGGSGGGETNITISCTNCTAMTPAFCAALKDSLLARASSIIANVDSVNNSVSILRDQFSFLENSIDTLKQEGDSFSMGKGNEFLSSATTFPYLRDFDGYNFDSPPIPSQPQNMASSGNNSIYTYYNESVKPVLDSAFSEIQGYRSMTEAIVYDLGNLSSDANSLNSYVSELDCSACQQSQTVTLPSGGGSSTNSVSSGCPCAEILIQIKAILDSMKTDLAAVRLRLDGWETSIKNIERYLSDIKSDVYKIRSVTDRMDDFFKDDTDYNFKKLIEHTLTLSNAVFSSTLSLPPNLYWTEYTNATQFLSAEGSSIDWLQKGRTIESGADGSVIDFGEYGTLNWFQRMEFLLGHIAGIFSTTNSTNADFSSEQKEKTDRSQAVFDGLTFDQEKSLLQQMVHHLEQVEDSLNPFHGLFDYSSGSTRSITFLPDVSVENDLLANTMPTFTMDLTETGNGSFSISDLVDLAHNLTTFLWLVSFLIVDILAIIKFVQCLIALNRWYWKIYNSWVSTMFNGGGR